MDKASLYREYVAESQRMARTAGGRDKVRLLQMAKDGGVALKISKDSVRAINRVAQ
jgi:hypothetical protein